MPPVLRYAGFGNESTFGTAVPAQFHVDIMSASLDAPADTELYYAGGLGRGIRTRRPGYYHPTGNVVYGWDIRTIAAMLRWALGGYKFTAGSPNQHEIWALNDSILPSFTTRIGKDVFEHVFAGCVANSLQLGLSEDFLQATMDIGASVDSKAALTPIANLLLPEEFPLAFHEVTFELPSASDLSANVRSLSLTIANSLQGDAGRALGSRHPVRLPVGARDVTLALELWYEDTSQLERFWGGASGPDAAGAADFTARIVADAGSDGQLEIDIASAHFSGVQTQPSGRDELTQTCAIRCLVAEHTLADSVTVVESELLATVSNAMEDLAA